MTTNKGKTTLETIIGVEVHVQPGFFNETRKQRELFRKYRSAIQQLKSQRGYDLDRLAFWLADLEIAQSSHLKRVEDALRYYQKTTDEYRQVVEKQREDIEKLHVKQRDLVHELRVKDSTR